MTALHWAWSCDYPPPISPPQTQQGIKYIEALASAWVEGAGLGLGLSPEPVNTSGDSPAVAGGKAVRLDCGDLETAEMLVSSIRACIQHSGRQ